MKQSLNCGTVLCSKINQLEIKLAIIIKRFHFIFVNLEYWIKDEWEKNVLLSNKKLHYFN